MLYAAATSSFFCWINNMAILVREHQRRGNGMENMGWMTENGE